MSPRAKRLSALYLAHGKAEGAERARLHAEINELLGIRNTETLNRITRAVENS